MAAKADVYGFSERLMSMDDAVWERHANPWSVWTRFTCLPLLVLAVWSRVWLGWGALVPFALACLWTWVNPRAFPRPTEFGSWAARAVLGERVFLNRAAYGVPHHHVMAAHLTAGLSAFGALVMIWGLIVLNPLATVLGMILTILPKVWFCDRMVWLHVDITGIPFGTPMPEPILPEEAR